MKRLDIVDTLDLLFMLVFALIVFLIVDTVKASESYEDEEEEAVCVDYWWDEPNLTRHCVRWLVIDEENCMYNFYGYEEE